MKELTKRDWQNLIEYGIVTKAGNGFANTTSEFEIKYGAYTKKQYIKLKGKRKVYVYFYQDGCFYPLWFVSDNLNEKINIVEKLSKIESNV